MVEEKIVTVKKRSFLASLIITMITLMATSVLVPGIYIEGLATTLVSALVIGLINAVIKPIFTILTLPFTILTFGLFLFVINGLMLLLAARIVPGFVVEGLGSAIIGSIVISLFTWVINNVF
ncbi:MAG: phage holin family protein [Bacillota bacterium]